jgi:8-oxo-dGTP pyrophosphatase MutT (NUDIX family)/phosphohistidine phosphatase SixA
MSIASSLPDVHSAGAVVTRPGRQVLLVHRPKYDDWSFPKGKLDRSEHVTAAAVREVAEETELDVRLGPPLRAQRYAAGNRMKTVHYWMGRVIGDDDVSKYVVNDEIDGVAWVPFDDAMNLLTYPYDRETLRESTLVSKKTRAFVVLRHGQARARKSWRKDDRLRPLLKVGTLQAQRTVPVLAAYDVSTLASSSSTRCLQTLTPYADVTGLKLRSFDGLSEEDATADSVLGIVDDLVHHKAGVVLCTHRPVLPTVFDALGVPDVKLEPGSMLVVHLRKGKVVATERHSR